MKLDWLAKSEIAMLIDLTVAEPLLRSDVDYDLVVAGSDPAKLALALRYVKEKISRCWSLVGSNTPKSRRKTTMSAIQLALRLGGYLLDKA